MTGNSDSGSECLLKNAPSILGCKIDEKLKGTQIMLATLNSIDTADDDYLEEKVTQAKWFAGIAFYGNGCIAAVGGSHGKRGVLYKAVDENPGGYAVKKAIDKCEKSGASDCQILIEEQCSR